MKRHIAAAIEVLTSRRVLTAAAVIGVISALLGVGINTALSRFVLALPQGAELPDTRVAPRVADVAEPPEPLVPRALSRDAYIDPILRRNMFDSSAVGTLISEGGDDSPLTDLNLTLLATVVAVPDIYSSALISEGSSGGKALGFGIGDKLTGGEGTIIAIEQKRVLIRRSSGREEYLEMGGGSGVKQAPVAAEPGAEEEGITREGDKVVVERKVIDDALGNLESLASKIRAVPHKGPDGEIDGFRLSAIRRGTLFDKLGIKNGDIIHAVNGQPLTSADGALALYQQMQNESSFSFEVTRRNQKQTLAFEIR